MARARGEGINGGWCGDPVVCSFAESRGNTAFEFSTGSGGLLWMLNIILYDTIQ